MKKKLLSLLLVVCMLVCSLGVLAACNTDDDVTPPPAGPDKTNQLVAMLTADTLKGILEDLDTAYAEAPELDIADAIKDVNIYADQMGEGVSVKDGYIVVTDANNTEVIGFRDGYAIITEEGEVVNQELIVQDVPAEQVSAVLDQLSSMIDRVVELDTLPAVTAADITRIDGWYCFTDDYVSRLAKGVIATYMGMMGGSHDEEAVAPVSEGAEAETEEVDPTEQINQMIDSVLAVVDVTIGFAFDGETINGLLLDVNASDLSKIADMTEMEMTGSAGVRLETKLSADLSSFSYLSISGVSDMVQEGVSTKQDISCRISYADSALTVEADVYAEMEGQLYDGDAKITIAHDADYMPTLLTANGNVKLNGIKVDSVSGNYTIEHENGSTSHSVRAWVTADVTATANATVDFTKLAGSGKVVDGTVTVSAVNPTLHANEVTQYVDNPLTGEEEVFVILTEEQVLASFSDDEKASLENLEELNGGVEAALTTENGEGTLTLTMTLANGDTQTISVEIGVNSDKAVSAPEADKNAIANHDIEKWEQLHTDAYYNYIEYRVKHSTWSNSTVSQLAADELAELGGAAEGYLITHVDENDKTWSTYVLAYYSVEEASAHLEAVSSDYSGEGLTYRQIENIVAYGEYDMVNYNIMW